MGTTSPMLVAPTVETAVGDREPSLVTRYPEIDIVKGPAILGVLFIHARPLARHHRLRARH